MWRRFDLIIISTLVRECSTLCMNLFFVPLVFLPESQPVFC